MTKKLILVLLLPLMADLLVSCCRCFEPESHNYTNKSITVSALDNSGTEAREISTGSVYKTAFGIRTLLVREKIVRLCKPTFVIGQAAYAYGCRCDKDTYEPKDSITAVKITTLRNFNTDHPANSDVSDYFKVYYGGYFSTIENFFKSSGATLYNESDMQLTFDMLLMTPPASGGTHQFRVQFVLSDGRILEQDTPTLDFI